MAFRHYKLPITIISQKDQEYLEAEIDIKLTKEPREPVEFVIHSKQNLLLLFNSKVSPQLAVQMCSQLLMETMRPEDIPQLFEDLVSEINNNPDRQIKLTASSDLNYTLSISDIVKKQIFPRFALPFIKQNSDQVSLFLKQLSENLLNDNKALELNLQQQRQDYAVLQSHAEQQGIALRSTTQEYRAYKDQMEQLRCDQDTKIQLLQQDLQTQGQRQSIENQNLKQQLTIAQQSLSETTESLNKTTAQLHQLEVDYSASRQQASGSMSGLEKISADLAEVKAKCGQLELENRQLLMEKTAASGELQNYREQSSQQSGNLAQKLTECQSNNQQISQELAQTKQFLGVEAELRAKFQATCEQQDAQIRIMQADREQLFAAFQAAGGRIEQLNAETQQLQQIIGAKDAEQLELNQKVAQMQGLVEERDADNRKLNAQNVVLKKEAERAGQRAEAAEMVNGKQMLDRFYGEGAEEPDSAAAFLAKNRQMREEIAGRKGASPQEQKVGVKSQRAAGAQDYPPGDSVLSGYRQYLQDSGLPPRAAAASQSSAMYVDLNAVLRQKQESAAAAHENEQKFGRLPTFSSLGEPRNIVPGALSPNQKSSSSETNRLIDTYLQQNNNGIDAVRLMSRPAAFSAYQQGSTISRLENQKSPQLSEKQRDGMAGVLSNQPHAAFGLSGIGSGVTPEVQRSQAGQQVSGGHGAAQSGSKIGQTNVPLALNKYKQIMEDDLL